MKTVKIFILTLLIILLVGGLVSCGKGDLSSGEDERVVPADQYAENTADQTPYVTTPAPTVSEECRSAYSSFLKKYLSDSEGLSAGRGCFALVYVDADDTPELVVSADDYHAARAELYTYDEGSVKKLGDYGQWGTLGCIERRGVIIDCFSQSGKTEQAVYSLSYGKIKKVCYYQELPVYVTADENDEDEFRYFIDDEEVTLEKYRESYSENVPSDPVWIPDVSESGSYPLTESGIESCFGEGGASTEAVGKSSGNVYAPVVKNYGSERVRQAAVMGNNISMPVYEYAVKDINSDGVDELVIRERSGDDPSGTIGAIYTLKDGVPLELYFIERHGSYSISSDGYFIFLYHEATIEKLVGAELVKVAESQRLPDEDHGEEYKAFLKANGVSDEEMVFDYVTYNG